MRHLPVQSLGENVSNGRIQALHGESWGLVQPSLSHENPTRGPASESLSSVAVRRRGQELLGAPRPSARPTVACHPLWAVTRKERPTGQGD